MDQNYVNMNASRPDWQGPPGLAGALASRDQQNYQQAMALQKLFQTQSAMDQQLDAPVKAQTRLGDIAFQRGRAATAEESAREQLAGQVVGNRFSELSMRDRLTQQRNTARQGTRDNNEADYKQAIERITMLADAAADAGPAAHRAVRDKAKEFNVAENDPILNYILSSDNPTEIRDRASYVQNRYHMADKGYATEAMKQSGENTRAILNANNRMDVAREKTPREKHDETRWAAYQDQVKQEHPTWSPQQIRSEAVQRMDAGQYGAARPVDTAEGKELEQSIAGLEKTLGFIPADSPLRKQLEDHVKLLKAQRGVRRPPYGGGGQPGAAAPGTASNPIPLR